MVVAWFGLIGFGFRVFETRSHVAQAVLKLTLAEDNFDFLILLPLPPKFWDYGPMTSCLTGNTLFLQYLFNWGGMDVCIHVGTYMTKHF